MTDYVTYHQHLEERLIQLGRELPGPLSGFARLHKKAVEAGALSAKVKELMALVSALPWAAMAVLPIMFMMQLRQGLAGRSCWKRLGWP